jgi:hypothetical protein
MGVCWKEGTSAILTVVERVNDWRGKEHKMEGEAESGHTAL